jgi:Cu/Ag efflux pump CusA
LGPGSETQRPMAITIIGGVFVSTFLTLLSIPSFHSIMSRFEKRSKSNVSIKKAFADSELAKT